MVRGHPHKPAQSRPCQRVCEASRNCSRCYGSGAGGGGTVLFSNCFFSSPPIADLNHMVEAGSRVRFYHLAAGLISPIVLLSKAKVFSPSTPIGTGFLNFPALRN